LIRIANAQKEFRGSIGGWPGIEEFTFVDMRIVRRITLRHIRGKDRVAEGAPGS